MTKSWTKSEAEKVAELTSMVYQQGSTWVFQETDIETGTTRLSRGHTQKSSERQLKIWRRERVEALLRADPQAPAYVLRVWHENPSWKGEGVWHWASTHWYTTEEEAKLAMEPKAIADPSPHQVLEIPRGELPGHFTVA
ncbi:MAG: hypothetical protein KA436_05360 [Oligoflexales bacterium]|nr:hypothetical protein [Oligoflexales bacterium]